MPPGKLAAQAGHAFLEAYLRSPPELSTLYRQDSPGTKVVLVSKTEHSLLLARDKCDRLGIPCALIIDSGHIFPPFFDGFPIVTALGIGLSEEVEKITKNFQLLEI
jgi:PTH2 family peptidyl-tRNA hydrolase